MSLMKNIIAVVLIVGVLASCSESNSQGQREGISISGTVMNPTPGIITIDQMFRDHTQPLDTITVGEDNTFNYRFTGPSGYYRINFYSTQAATIIIDKDNLIINFDGNNATGNLAPEGSSEMKQIEEFYTAISEEFGPKEQEINNTFVTANQTGNTDGADAARAEYMALTKKKQVEQNVI